MFSENNQISRRQTFRLMTYDLLGFGTLMIPTILARTAGRDGIFCIVTGTLLALLFLQLLKGLQKEIHTDYVSFLYETCGKVIGKILLTGYLIYFAVLSGYVSYIFVTLILSNLLKNVSFYLVLFLILLLAYYGLKSGVEGRARIYEMLFWFILIPLFLMLLFAMKDVEVCYFSPIGTTGISNMITGSYYVLFCYSIIAIAPFLTEYVTEKEKAYLEIKKAVLCAGAIIAALYPILLGLFGVEKLKTIEFAAVTMMSRVQISGGFLKRTDAFMFGIWFFTLFALLNGTIFYSGNILREICFKKGKKDIFYLIMLVAVYGMAVLFYQNDSWQSGTYLWKLGVPFLIAVPAFLLIIKKCGKKCITAMAMLLCLFFLSGCEGVAELEEKEFPLVLAVRDTNNFSVDWLNQQNEGNQIKDFNHLKVILVEQDFLEDASSVDEMLDLLQKNKEVPWNTYVVAVDNCDNILNSEENLSEPLGNYLERLLENTSQVSKDAYPTIGMLYEEQENHMETLFIPYIELSGQEPAITGYEVWKRGDAAGEMDANTAMLNFFIENQLKEYTIQLALNEFVQLKESDNQVELQEKKLGDGRVKKEVTVSIAAEGEVLGGTGDKAYLELQMEDYFSQVANKALEKNIDPSNSYRLMGEQQRSWFSYYQNAPAFYEENIAIRFELKIHWKN